MGIVRVSRLTKRSGSTMVQPVVTLPPRHPLRRRHPVQTDSLSGLLALSALVYCCSFSVSLSSRFSRLRRRHGSNSSRIFPCRPRCPRASSLTCTTFRRIRVPWRRASPSRWIISTFRLLIRARSCYLSRTADPRRMNMPLPIPPSISIKMFRLMVTL